MKCPVCHSRIPDDASYCPNCRTRLNNASAGGQFEELESEETVLKVKKPYLWEINLLRGIRKKVLLHAETVPLALTSRSWTIRICRMTS